MRIPSRHHTQKFVIWRNASVKALTVIRFHAGQVTLSLLPANRAVHLRVRVSEAIKSYIQRSK